MKKNEVYVALRLRTHNQRVLVDYATVADSPEEARRLAADADARDPESAEVAPVERIVRFDVRALSPA